MEIVDNKITQVPSVTVAQLRSMIFLLFPEEMTPLAKRMLEKICDEHDER